MKQQTALSALVADLRGRFGSKITVVSRTDDAVFFQFGAKEESVLGVRLTDAAVPRFGVSYPTLRVRRDGGKVVSVQDADDVFLDGVLWIAKKMARHGFVPPEF
jgi:hypothetical protein